MASLTVPISWRKTLAPETSQAYFQSLERFLEDERASHRVYPPAENVFSALALTPPEAVRVIILGQDPYHGAGQAHGLAFSVPAGVKSPPSLRNIFKELQADIGIPLPAHGSLEAWARQGVLLLNTALTVRADSPASHKNRGWERFTDAVICAVNQSERPCVFTLWGAHAHQKESLIDAHRHAILKAAHPSPLSARNGFFGCKHFSQINALLERWGEPPIDWRT